MIDLFSTGRKSTQSLAIDIGLELAVDYWLEDNMEEASHLMDLAEAHFNMSAKDFNERYKESNDV